MMHPHCRMCGHNWDNWRWMPADADGREATVDRAADTYSFPDGSRGVYFYKRECQNSGCDAVERAERLLAMGTSTIQDTHASERK